MRFDVITIFPHLFDSFLQESLLGKAQKRGLLTINVYNLRSWTTDKHETVDDRPYGGGPGMIIKIEPVFRALREIIGRDIFPCPRQKLSPVLKEKRDKIKIAMMDPGGKQFNQQMAKKFSKLNRLILLCGRYEGFDYRVTKFVDERVSIGPYVLSGGEVPAMVIIEAVARLLPGFLGKPESLKEETFNINSKMAEEKASQFMSIKNFKKLIKSQFIEYPQYTRPEIFKYQEVNGEEKILRVPKILLSGNHKKIKEWREKQAKQKIFFF
jgi:tRNA (guanine37-N1)-methyltransferase